MRQAALAHWMHHHGVNIGFSDVLLYIPSRIEVESEMRGLCDELVWSVPSVWGILRCAWRSHQEISDGSAITAGARLIRRWSTADSDLTTKKKKITFMLRATESYRQRRRCFVPWKKVQRAENRDVKQPSFKESAQRTTWAERDGAALEPISPQLYLILEHSLLYFVFFFYFPCSLPPTSSLPSLTLALKNDLQLGLHRMTDSA